MPFAFKVSSSFIYSSPILISSNGYFTSTIKKSFIAVYSGGWDYNATNASMDYKIFDDKSSLKELNSKIKPLIWLNEYGPKFGLVVVWSNTEKRNDHNHTNTFSAILTTDNEHFIWIFNYKTLSSPPAYVGYLYNITKFQKIIPNGENFSYLIENSNNAISQKGVFVLNYTEKDPSLSSMNLCFILFSGVVRPFLRI
jgi:hypothetical protein